MVSLDFTQRNVKHPRSPYSIEHGLFLRLLPLPFVAIMLKIKAGILNTNSVYVQFAYMLMHGKQPNTRLKKMNLSMKK